MPRVPRTGALSLDRERRRAGDRLPEQAEEACLKAYVRACRAEAAERLILAMLNRAAAPAD